MAYFMGSFEGELGTSWEIQRKIHGVMEIYGELIMVISFDLMVIRIRTMQLWPWKQL